MSTNNNPHVVRVHSRKPVWPIAPGRSPGAPRRPRVTRAENRALALEQLAARLAVMERAVDGVAVRPGELWRSYAGQLLLEFWASPASFHEIRKRTSMESPQSAEPLYALHDAIQVGPNKARLSSEAVRALLAIQAGLDLFLPIDERVKASRGDASRYAVALQPYGQEVVKVGEKQFMTFDAGKVYDTYDATVDCSQTAGETTAIQQRLKTHQKAIRVLSEPGVLDVIADGTDREVEPILAAIRYAFAYDQMRRMGDLSGSRVVDVGTMYGFFSTPLGIELCTRSRDLLSMPETLFYVEAAHLLGYPGSSYVDTQFLPVSRGEKPGYPGLSSPGIVWTDYVLERATTPLTFLAEKPVLKVKTIGEPGEAHPPFITSSTVLNQTQAARLVGLTRAAVSLKGIEAGVDPNQTAIVWLQILGYLPPENEDMLIGRLNNEVVFIPPYKPGPSAFTLESKDAQTVVYDHAGVLSEEVFNELIAEARHVGYSALLTRRYYPNGSLEQTLHENI
jgi:hypothetical protein